MTRVTQVTENRIKKLVKDNRPYGEQLEYILNTYKGTRGCYGATITEMKKWNIELDNDFQIRLTICNTIRGMGVKFSELMNTAETHDMSHVTIKDFNELVKMINA